MAFSGTGYSGVDKAFSSPPLLLTGQPEIQSGQGNEELNSQIVYFQPFIFLTLLHAYLCAFFSLSVSVGSKVMEW